MSDHITRESSESDNRLRSALIGSGDVLWDIDLLSWTLYRVGGNPQALPDSAEAGIPFDAYRQAIHAEDVEEADRAMQAHIQGHTDLFDHQYRVMTAARKWIWVHIRGKVSRRDAAGLPLRLSGWARDISDSREREQAGRIAAEVIRNMSEAVAVTDLEFRIIRVNPACLQMLGYAEDEMLGQTPAQFYSARHSAQFYQSIIEILLAGGRWCGEAWQLRRDGTDILAWCEFCAVADANGRRASYLAVMTDISARRAAENKQRIAVEVLRHMSEAVSVTNAQFKVIAINDAFTRMFGYSEDEILGQPVTLLQSDLHPSEFYEGVRDVLRGGGRWSGERWQRHRDGRMIMTAAEFCAVQDSNGEIVNYVAVFSDITARKNVEQELLFLVNYDALTGLPNRTLLDEHLAHALKFAQHAGTRLALLFIDLDHFKQVNDSLGHAAGDATLKAVGAGLRSCVRENDTVAHLSGDEFAIVVENLESRDEAENVARRIIALFAQPLQLAGEHEVAISASIGIGLFPEHSTTAEDLLRCADAAMYLAKESGRSRYAVYSPVVDSTTRHRATMAAELRKAIERNELTLVYQPKARVRDNQIIGVEALMRWRNEKFGQVPPTIFIPLAEEFGLINEIGDFALNEACAQLQFWHASGLAELNMAVNVSVLQLLSGELPRRLRSILAEHDLAARHLELELTETTLMANAEQSLRVLNQLKQLGVSLSIDDFGTGYSSLSYLKRLPIDTLKIDQSFISDITRNSDDAAITSAIIKMAHSLYIMVVAEGVETHEQLQFLHDHHCDQLQGLWLSPALEAAACFAFLTRDQTLR
jgi:diguanylate cyclase (GGDEF)-like protein/PAS domain S-box-containing protein